MATVCINDILLYMAIQQQVLEDFINTGGLPIPWNSLEVEFSGTIDYADGARRIAQLFIRSEEHCGADLLLCRLFAAKPKLQWLERFLFGLFHIGISHVQVANQVLRLKNLRRLLLRIENGERVSKTEYLLSRDLRSKIALKNVGEVFSCAYFARNMLVLLFRKEEIHETHRTFLTYLIRAEVAALKERINHISETVDVYNLKAMAKVLPWIRIFDENAQEALDIATIIEQQQQVGRPILTFANALGDSAFDKWGTAVGREPVLKELFEALAMQKRKKIPIKTLIALSSLCRRISDGLGGPQDPLLWIRMALTHFENGRFSINARSAIDAVADFALGGGARIEGTVISGNFTDHLYAQWLGPDLLTVPVKKSVSSESPHIQIRDLVRANVHNDVLIERLLNQSTVYSMPGMVEYLAVHSRSVTVLSKIATASHLHSGSANRVVPLALLKNPTHIPLAFLRHFLKPSFISQGELNMLARNPSGLRPEVAQEIQWAVGG